MTTSGQKTPYFQPNSAVNSTLEQCRRRGFKSRIDVSQSKFVQIRGQNHPFGPSVFGVSLYLIWGSFIKILAEVIPVEHWKITKVKLIKGLSSKYKFLIHSENQSTIDFHFFSNESINLSDSLIS